MQTTIFGGFSCGTALKNGLRRAQRQPTHPQTDYEQRAGGILACVAQIPIHRSSVHVLSFQPFRDAGISVRMQLPQRWNPCRFMVAHCLPTSSCGTRRVQIWFASWDKVCVRACPLRSAAPDDAHPQVRALHWAPLNLATPKTPVDSGSRS